ncbi:MAG: FG-GAP-like repeat-containing protein [Flavobacteriales bacterium]
MKYTSLIFLISTISFLSNGQTFVDVSEAMGVSHSFTNGEYAGGCSFFDFNRDGLDDISLPSADGAHKFYLASPQGIFQELPINGISGEVKSFIWVDFDNDGDSDLSYTVYDGQFYLLENQGNLGFNEVDLNIEANVTAPNNGISWADYDNDGFLDFYVARYNSNPTLDSLYSNRLIRNHGDGSFSDQTQFSGTSNELKHSFSGTWFDYNQDGHIDLHVINDRSISYNALYENNGDGTFTEVTFTTGADVNIDCMSNTVEDYDNDGDYDLYLSNGEAGNHLLRASGTFGFQNLFPQSGTEMNQVCWGANWFDFDHNGWKDLYVCAEDANTNNGFFINDEGTNFERLDEYFPLNPKKSFSSAKGNLNGDGLYDLIVLNEFPYQTSLFRNNFQSDYQYISVSLTGTFSNRDAIGSRIDYYTNGTRITELTHAGTNYMSQDSQYKLLSLPNGEAILDSLVITWPRGLKESFTAIPSGSHLELVEGSSLTYSLSNAPLPSICPGESTSISIIAQCDSVVWTNGINNPEIIIEEPGNYSATLFFNGYQIDSEEFSVALSPSPVVDSVLVTPPLCFGENSGVALIYSSSSESSFPLPVFEVDSLAAGNYFPTVSIEGLCPTVTNFQVDQPSELFTINSIQHVQCFGDSTGSVNFSSFGGTGEITHELTPNLIPTYLPAGNYEVISTDENSCTTSSTFDITQPDPLILDLLVEDATGINLGSLGFSITGGTTPYTTMLNESPFNDSEASGLVPGQYCISVEDNLGCMVSVCDSIALSVNIEKIYNSSISAYPNPARETITLEGLPNETVTVSLLNTIGLEVLSKVALGNSFQISVNQLSAGTYYLRCKTQDQTTILLRKILIN